MSSAAGTESRTLVDRAKAILMKPKEEWPVVGAVIAFALSLLGTYVVARVIDYLAPRYGGTRDLTGAFKVSAYSSTAQWLVGIFALIPALSALSILGLYGLYLLYLGLLVVLKVPAEKAMSYTVAVVVAVILVFIVI